MERHEYIPPVVLTVSALEDGDDLALLETEITSLVRVKVVHGDRLVLLEQRLLSGEVRLGSRRPAGTCLLLCTESWAGGVLVDIVIVVASCEGIRP